MASPCSPITIAAGTRWGFYGDRSFPWSQAVTPISTAPLRSRLCLAPYAISVNHSLLRQTHARAMRKKNGRVILQLYMGLNIKNREVETLVDEIARLTK